MTVRVSEVVGQALARLGGRTVFGLMGSGNLAVTNALRAGGATVHLARHEGGAICMADGYARVSGRLAVCSVHQGPGLTNAVTGLTEAAKSRTPLILLAADTPAAALTPTSASTRRRSCAASGRSPSASTRPPRPSPTSRAPCAGRRSSAGPVVLMLPLDVAAQEAAATAPRRRSPARSCRVPWPAAASVDRVAGAAGARPSAPR